MKTRTISQCFTKCYCSYVTYVVVVKTEWKRQKWIHIKSISMHACTYIVHIHKCTYALRKCLSHTYRLKCEGMSQSCDIIVSMQHAHLNECSTIVWCVCVVGGCSDKPISFQQHTCYSFGLILLGFFFFFSIWKGGKCPCCPLAGFTAYGLNTPTNKMLTQEET